MEGKKYEVGFYVKFNFVLLFFILISKKNSLHEEFLFEL